MTRKTRPRSQSEVTATTSAATDGKETCSSRSSDLLAKDKAAATVLFFTQDNNRNLFHWLEDVLQVQVQVQVPAWMNMRHNFAFLLYGSLYQGMVHE